MSLAPQALRIADVLPQTWMEETSYPPTVGGWLLVPVWWGHGVGWAFE